MACHVIGCHPSVCISIQNDHRREEVLLHADLEVLKSRRVARLQVGTLTRSSAAKVCSLPWPCVPAAGLGSAASRRLLSTEVRDVRGYTSRKTVSLVGGSSFLIMHIHSDLGFGGSTFQVTLTRALKLSEGRFPISCCPRLES